MRFSLLAAFFFLFSTSTAQAIVYTVDTTTDEAGAGFQVCSAAAGDCSLRGAVIKANTDAVEDEISVPAGTYTVNIDRAAEAQNAGALTETEGDIDIIQPLKITGAGADVTTIQGAFTVDVNKQDRIFMVNLGGAGGVTFSGLTITGGRGDRGGGIWGFGAPVTVTGCVFTGNQATNEGGGLSSDNAAGVEIRVANSTFSENTAGGRGGGMFFETAEAFITNTTFSNNTVTGDGTDNNGGGAIDVTTGKMTLIHTTLSGNKVTTAGSIGGAIRFAAGGTGALILKNNLFVGNQVGGVGQNCAQGPAANAPDSQGYNLSDDASCTALFFNDATDQNGVAGTIVSATLADNGGPTLTLLPPDGSLAIDFVPAANCTDDGGAALTEDQRGSTRPEDGDDDGTADCDAGAVEVEAAASGTTGGSTTGGTAGTAGTTGGTSGGGSGGGCSLIR